MYLYVYSSIVKTHEQIMDKSVKTLKSINRLAVSKFKI